MQMTAWNVRVREDTAKYLLNLDTESAFYDPKTRSMRENPFPDKVRACAIGALQPSLVGVDHHSVAACLLSRR